MASDVDYKHNRKKGQKVTRGSHRNDVSPLTQGLRYRAACDNEATCSKKHNPKYKHSHTKH